MNRTFSTIALLTLSFCGWVQSQTVRPFDRFGAPSSAEYRTPNSFGTSLDYFNSHLVVGSPGVDELDVLLPGEVFLYELEGAERHLRLHIKNESFPADKNLGLSVALNETALVASGVTYIDSTKRFVGIRLFERTAPDSEDWIEQPLIRLGAPDYVTSATKVTSQVTRSGNGFLVSVLRRVYEIRKTVEGGWTVIGYMEAPEGFLFDTSSYNFLLVHEDELFVMARTDGREDEQAILCYRRENNRWVFQQALFTPTKLSMPRIATNGDWLALSFVWSEVVLLYPRVVDSGLWSEDFQRVRMEESYARPVDLAFDHQRLLVAIEGVPGIKVFENSGESDQWDFVATLRDHSVHPYDYGGALVVTEDSYINGSGPSSHTIVHGEYVFPEGRCRVYKKDFLLRYDDWIKKFYSEDEIAAGLAGPFQKVGVGTLTNQECYSYGLNPRNPDSSKTPRMVREEDGSLAWQYQLAQQAGDWTVWPDMYWVGGQWWTIPPRVNWRDYKEGVTIYRRRISHPSDRWLYRLRFLPNE